MEAPAEQTHTLAPENLPPDLIEPLSYDPKVFDRPRKVAIVAELIKSGKPVSEICARHPPISPHQLRGWSNAYNVEAVKLLKAEEAKRLLGSPDVTEPRRRDYTPAERLKYIAAYRASGLGPTDASKVLGVPTKNLRRWLEAEAAIKEPYPKRKAVAGPGANITDETRAKAVERIKAGDALTDIQRDLLVSQKSLRNWWLKATGQKLKAGAHRHMQERKPMETTITETPKPKASHAKPRQRRPFTEKEKILYAVRFQKLGVSMAEGARHFDVSQSVLRRWVRAFQAMKPQARGAYARIEEGTNGLPVGGHIKQVAARHREASEMLDSGVHIVEVAKKFKAHRDTVKAWWIKVNPGKPWSLTKKGGGKPYGPNKMTRNKMSVRDAVLSNSKVLTAQYSNQLAGAKDLDDVPQPQQMATGRATHDAIIFLKMARDLAAKRVKSGAMQIDDPLLLFSMLALNALSK